MFKRILAYAVLLTYLTTHFIDPIFAHSSHGNIWEISQTGNNIKNPLTLATTTTTSHRKSGGWFGSDTYHSETSTSHTSLANTTIAGGNNTKVAGKNINRLNCPPKSRTLSSNF